MDIPIKAHVLVVDGRKLLFFKNTGTAAAPVLTVVSHEEQVSAATRDQGSDRPGSNQSGKGASHSGYEQTDYHQLDEDRFALEAANMLKREVLAGHIHDLIIVAAPRTLGELRKHYHSEVQKRVAGEISKDLAGRPTSEIAAAIAAN